MLTMIDTGVIGYPVLQYTKKAEHYMWIRRAELSYAMDGYGHENNYIRGQKYRAIEIDLDE